MKEYKTTIGLEVHVELKTNAKVFSSSLRKFNSLPNRNINLFDFGIPGSLPVLNKRCLELGLRACHVLHAEIEKDIVFDRKSYTYPDNPKNYQITQGEKFLGKEGYLEVFGNKIRIEELHLEEDMAKTIHKDGASYLDMNRAGIPLIEIVTKPELHSGKDASEFVRVLQEELIYAGVSDCKIEEGSMRCDVNISVSKDETLGRKVEIKNIGSISNIERAIALEEKRQIELLEEGEEIKEATFRYDDSLDQNIFMRYKDRADYHYVREINIPRFKLSDFFIEEVINNLPMSPKEIRDNLKSFNIKDVNIEKIMKNIETSTYLSTLFEKDINMVTASNLLLTDINVKEYDLKKEDFIKIVKAFDEKFIKQKDIQDILKLLKNKEIDEILKEFKNDLIESDEEILKYVNLIITREKESVKDYLSGNERALRYLMGQLMKETKGKIRADKGMRLFKEELEKME